MSVESMAKVWNLDLPPGTKLVLLAIADHCDPYGKNAFPSHALLARKSGYSVRQIKRIIDGLVACGLLRVQVGAGGTALLRDDRRPNLYEIMHDRVVAVTKQEMSLSNGADANLRREVIEAGSQRCHWCGQDGDETNGADGYAWHVDRLMRGVDGGQYVFDNVVLSCRSCNLARGDRMTSRREREDIHASTGGHGRADGGTGVTKEPSRTTQEPSPGQAGSDELTLAVAVPSVVDPFDRFYEAYPRKAGRPAARRSWKAAVKRDGIDAIRAGFKIWTAHWTAEGTPESLIPYPATWLNQQRYNDSPPPPLEAPAARNSARPGGVIDNGSQAEREADRAEKRAVMIAVMAAGATPSVPADYPHTFMGYELDFDERFASMLTQFDLWDVPECRSVVDDGFRAKWRKYDLRHGPRHLANDDMYGDDQ